MKINQENLLIADFQNSEGHFANAIIWNYFVSTAWHVARTNPVMVAKDFSMRRFIYRKIENRDLALSTDRIYQTRGFEKIFIPQIGDKAVVCGYHGKNRSYFEINVVVVAYDNFGRIMIEAIPRMGMKKAKILRRKLVPEDFENYFRLGMSGSPTIGKNNEVIGILVSGAKGNFNGHRALLEPAKFLL